MFKVNIHFFGGSSFSYNSNDKEEPNKIRYSLDNHTMLPCLEGNREFWINPRNILFVDIVEVTQ